VSRKCSRAERPWVWGMLVYTDVTSTVTKMVGILDIGRAGQRLEMVVTEGGDSFSGRSNTGNDGSAGITRFMDFGKQIQFRGSGFVRTEDSSSYGP